MLLKEQIINYLKLESLFYFHGEIKCASELQMLEESIC